VFPHPLLDPIRLEMKKVEHLLRSAISQVDEPLRSILFHSPGGGKQLRPASDSSRQRG